MLDERSLPSKLPWVVLPKANGAGEENLRLQERYARVVFFPHSAACPQWAAYVRELARAAAGLADWDARTVVVAPAGGGEAAAALQEGARGVTVLLDAPGEAGARARLEIPQGAAALVIADRFGDIWHGYHAGPGHALPDVRELEAWLRYLGTMCPE